jgi:hypothetical protein
MQINLKLEVLKVITLEFSLSSDKEKKEDDSKDNTKSTTADNKQ